MGGIGYGFRLLRAGIGGHDPTHMGWRHWLRGHGKAGHAANHHGRADQTFDLGIGRAVDIVIDQDGDEQASGLVQGLEPAALFVEDKQAD